MKNTFIMILFGLSLLTGCHRTTYVEHTEPEYERISGVQHAGVEQEKEEYR